MGTCVETLVNASTPCPYPPPPPPTHVYFAILIDLNHDTEPRHLNHNIVHDDGGNVLF